MRKLILSTIAVLAFGASAQASQVKAQVDNGYDYSHLKTFSASIATKWGNEIGEKQVLDEVTQALEARGWTQAPEGTADARVAIHGASKEKQRLDTFYSGGGGWGYYGMGGGMGTATTTETNYTEGTLVVDIFDAGTKQLVFRGTATDEVSNKQEKNVKKVENATKKMFKNFPPGVKVDKEEAKKSDEKSSD